MNTNEFYGYINDQKINLFVKNPRTNFLRKKVWIMIRWNVSYVVENVRNLKDSDFPLILLSLRVSRDQKVPGSLEKGDFASHSPISDNFNNYVKNINARRNKLYSILSWVWNIPLHGHKLIHSFDSNLSSLRAFLKHFFSWFKVVEKNALLCNTCRIRVMKDEVLEEGWKQNLPSHGFQVQLKKSWICHEQIYLYDCYIA